MWVVKFTDFKDGPNDYNLRGVKWWCYKDPAIVYPTPAEEYLASEAEAQLWCDIFNAKEGSDVGSA
jgi:hypothetical protein